MNLVSKANKNALTVYIEFPSEYDVEQIDVSTVKLIVNGVETNALIDPTAIGDENGNGVKDRMVKFDRSAVINALLGNTGNITMTVTGKLLDGNSFIGSDSVRVID